jgi:hypothetical protein
MLGQLPPFDAAPIPERAIDAVALRAVLRAIRERRSLDVLYQSMSRPHPARRAIEPHALAHDGFRWHARAFDRETKAFRDFVLGRLSKPRPGEPAGSMPRDDVEWHSFVALTIAPHPDLTPAQARAIAIDYGIRGGSTSIKVRRAPVLRAQAARPRCPARHPAGARAAHRAGQPRRGRGRARRPRRDVTRSPLTRSCFTPCCFAPPFLVRRGPRPDACGLRM